MTQYRQFSLVALALCGVTGLAVAQTPPQPTAPIAPDTEMAPPASSTSPTAPADASAAATTDPKLTECLQQEKAKDSAASDNQVLQKCMQATGTSPDK